MFFFLYLIFISFTFFSWLVCNFFLSCVCHFFSSFSYWFLIVFLLDIFFFCSVVATSSSLVYIWFFPFYTFQMTAFLLLSLISSIWCLSYLNYYMFIVAFILLLICQHYSLSLSLSLSFSLSLVRFLPLCIISYLLVLFFLVLNLGSPSSGELWGGFSSFSVLQISGHVTMLHTTQGRKEEDEYISS